MSHPGKFFTSIAVQLANNLPSLQQHIYDAITERKVRASPSATSGASLSSIHYQLTPRYTSVMIAIGPLVASML